MKATPMRFAVAISLLVAWTLAAPAFAAEPSPIATGPDSISVEQITRGPQSHNFGYIGHAVTIPWNATGRYIVSLRIGFHDRMPMPGETADVVLIDTHDGNRVTKVDQTLAWNLQQGTMLYWNPSAADRQFLFNDLDPATGQVFTVLYDIQEKRRLREFRFTKPAIGNGGVDPNGRYFAGINYGKITASREVISYAGAKDDLAEGAMIPDRPANPETDGLFLVDPALDGKRELILSYAKLAEFLFADEKIRGELGDPQKYPLYVHHTLWNRSGEWILFVVRGRQDMRPNIGCVIRRDGTGLRRIPYAGHPEWGVGSLLILPNKAEKRFDLYDVATEKYAGKLGDPGTFPNPIDDNALSPDGQWLAGSRRVKPTECVYTLHRLVDGLTVESPPLPTKDGGGVVRIDPAPRWNRTSDGLLVPGVADDGTMQLFTLKLFTLKLKPGNP
jgi:hypothetical protein